MERGMEDDWSGGVGVMSGESLRGGWRGGDELVSGGEWAGGGQVLKVAG